jgi:hypothetical protein
MTKIITTYLDHKKQSINLVGMIPLFLKEIGLKK